MRDWQSVHLLKKIEELSSIDGNFTFIKKTCQELMEIRWLKNIHMKVAGNYSEFHCSKLDVDMSTWLHQTDLSLKVGERSALYCKDFVFCFSNFVLLSFSRGLCADA